MTTEIKNRKDFETEVDFLPESDYKIIGSSRSGENVIQVGTEKGTNAPIVGVGELDSDPLFITPIYSLLKFAQGDEYTFNEQ